MDLEIFILVIGFLLTILANVLAIIRFSNVLENRLTKIETKQDGIYEPRITRLELKVNQILNRSNRLRIKDEN